MTATEFDVISSNTTSADTSPRVRNAALNLLARREHTRLELKQKLSRKFEDVDLVDQELNKLSAQNLLNEQRFTESFIRMRQRQGKGPKLIAQELKLRGVVESEIKEALNESTSEWSEIAEQVFIKKYGSKPFEASLEKSKRLKFLMTRGFDSDHIRSWLPKYFKP